LDGTSKLGDHQVGSAGFFIDLAVVDPRRPGRYLLGIECDGATYHSARSARDRDRLRQGPGESWLDDPASRSGGEPNPCRLFGFQRVGKDIKTRFQAVPRDLVTAGNLQVRDGQAPVDWPATER